MSTERTRENLQDNFGVEMRYNPEFLYALLTRDNKFATVELDNNWGEITDPNYDLFSSVKIQIDCPLLATVFKEYPNRTDKALVIHGKAVLNRYHPSLCSVNEMVERFSEPGLSLCSTGMKIGDSNGPNYYIGYTGSCNVVLVPDSDPYAFGIKLNCYPEESGKFLFSNEFQIVVPNLNRFGVYWNDGTRTDWSLLKRVTERHYWGGGKYDKGEIKLTGPQDVQRGLSTMAELLEKSLRFWYGDIAQMPLNRLVFAPKLSDKEKSKAYLAACSFCGSNYSIVKGPACPNCGASQPEFK